MSIPRIENEWIMNTIETENSFIIIPKLVHNNEQINLNVTAKMMYDMVDGKSDLKDICQKLVSIFKGMAYDEIYSDTLELYMTLWRLGIIAWNVNPCEADYRRTVGDYTVEFVSCDHVDDFHEAVNNCEFEYVMPFRYKEHMITDFDMRQAIVNNSNQYFVVKKQDMIMGGFVARIDIKEVSFIIDYCACSNAMLSLAEETWRGILGFARDMILGLVQGYVAKNINTYNWEIGVSAKESSWIDFMDKTNYFEKVVLKDECSDGDVIMYYLK